MSFSFKAICINDGPCMTCGIQSGLNKGATYTVTGVIQLKGIEFFQLVGYSSKCGHAEAWMRPLAGSFRFRITKSVELISSEQEIYK